MMSMSSNGFSSSCDKLLITYLQFKSKLRF